MLVSVRPLYSNSSGRTGSIGAGFWRDSQLTGDSRYIAVEPSVACWINQIRLPLSGNTALNVNFLIPLFKVDKKHYLP